MAKNEGCPLLTLFEKRAAAPPTPESWFFHHHRVCAASPGLAFVKLDVLIGTKWGSTSGGSKSAHPGARVAGRTSL